MTWGAGPPERKPPDDGDELTIQVLGYSDSPGPEGQKGQGLLLRTTRGDISCLVHPCEGALSAVLWVWGARGGFDGPAEGIYGVLAEELVADGIASLRLHYRHPGVFPDSVMDTLAGASFLKGLGFQWLALVGHSFGGAVVIAAAPFSPIVVAVAALSSQTYGAHNAAAVSPRPLLLVHGAEDTHLPPSCSQMISGWAKEPKELVLMPGAGHSLWQCKEQLHHLLKGWLVEKLRSAPLLSP